MMLNFQDFKVNRKEKQKEYSRKSYEKRKLENNLLEKHREYKKNNAEKIRKQKQEYRQKNIEKLKNYSLIYRLNNKENLKAYRREWRNKNLEKTKNYAKSAIGKFSKLKTDAKARNLIIQINFEEYFNLFYNKSCFYCGKDNASGLDRIDNNQGYILENCVACCKNCNIAKSNYSVKDFISCSICVAILHGNFFEIPVENISELWQNNCSNLVLPKSNDAFHKMKRNAKRRNINFQLTKCEYETYFFDKQCYLCNKMHCVGIDRIDNNIGYIFSNCSACCYACNIGKLDNSKEEYIERCVRIAKRNSHLLKNEK